MTFHIEIGQGESFRLMTDGQRNISQALAALVWACTSSGDGFFALRSLPFPDPLTPGFTRGRADRYDCQGRHTNHTCRVPAAAPAMKRLHALPLTCADAGATASTGFDLVRRTMPGAGYH